MNSPDIYQFLKKRVKKISDLIKIWELDALLLNSEANIAYTLGFKAPDSYCLVTQKQIFILTDFRYTADFKRKIILPNEVIEYSGSIFKEISTVISKLNLKKVGFESRHLTFAECQKLNDLSHGAFSLIPMEETIESLRDVKDSLEIKNIKKAVSITLKTLEFAKTILKPGRRETEIASELEHYMKKEGSQGCAFEIIVASGPNSSYPHAHLTKRKIQKGEPIIIDIGAVYEGYKSDLTRTFFLGKIKPSLKEIYEIISQAKEKAITLIKPGVKICDIDFTARNHISARGFGEKFGHALGHGVGIQAHESPAINKTNSQRLREGEIFTVEPAIYLADEFGIRLEDMVLVTKKGCEVLSGDNKH